MFVQHLQQPVERAFRPACYQHLPALGAALGYVFHSQGKDIDPLFAFAFGWLPRPARADMRVQRGDGSSLAILLIEGRQTHRIDGRKGRVEILAVEIKLTGRHGLVGRTLGRSLRLTGSPPRLVIIEHQLGPLLRRLACRVIGDDAEPLQVIEGRLQLLVKQRQPVLHAGITAALGNGLIKRIVARRRAEQRKIILAKPADRIRRQRHFAHRVQIERARLADGPLAGGIEGTDALQRIAEEIEPHRLLGSRGEAKAFDDVARRHLLQHGVDGDKHDGRMRFLRVADETGKRRQATRRRVGAW